MKWPSLRKDDHYFLSWWMCHIRLCISECLGRDKTFLIYTEIVRCQHEQSEAEQTMMWWQKRQRGQQISHQSTAQHQDQILTLLPSADTSSARGPLSIRLSTLSTLSSPVTGQFGAGRQNRRILPVMEWEECTDVHTHPVTGDCSLPVADPTSCPSPAPAIRGESQVHTRLWRR